MLVPGSSARSAEQQQCDSAVAATLFLFAVVLPPIRYGKFIYPERIAQILTRFRVSLNGGRSRPFESPNLYVWA